MKNYFQVRKRKRVSFRGLIDITDICVEMESRVSTLLGRKRER